MGIKDKDTPRALMELMYLLLALRLDLQLGILITDP